MIFLIMPSFLCQAWQTFRRQSPQQTSPICIIYRLSSRIRELLAFCFLLLHAASGIFLIQFVKDLSGILKLFMRFMRTRTDDHHMPRANAALSGPYWIEATTEHGRWVTIRETKVEALELILQLKRAGHAAKLIESNSARAASSTRLPHVKSRMSSINAILAMRETP